MNIYLPVNEWSGYWVNICLPVHEWSLTRHWGKLSTGQSIKTQTLLFLLPEMFNHIILSPALRRERQQECTSPALLSSETLSLSKNLKSKPTQCIFSRALGLPKLKGRMMTPSMVVCTCNPRTWEVEKGDREFRSYPQLHSEASLGYRRASVNEKAWWMQPVLGNPR